jgi:hypothetical protein
MITPGVATSGPLLNGLLAVRAEELVIFNDEASWNRMAVRWTEGGEDFVSGVYPGVKVGPRLDLRGDAKLVVSDGGIALAAAVRLSGEDERGARRALALIPTLDAMRERTRSCLAAFAAARPEDPSFRAVAPEAVQNTGALYATLQLVQHALAMRCRPVPAPCAVAPSSPKARQMLEQARRDCEAPPRKP